MRHTASVHKTSHSAESSGASGTIGAAALIPVAEKGPGVPSPEIVSGRLGAQTGGGTGAGDRPTEWVRYAEYGLSGEAAL